MTLTAIRRRCWRAPMPMTPLIIKTETTPSNGGKLFGLDCFCFFIHEEIAEPIKLVEEQKD